jgi:hypothetical protein
MRNWRGRDRDRDCESEGCEGDASCIHCDADMIDEYPTTPEKTKPADEPSKDKP